LREKPMIELRKYMARPMGTCFLGVKATKTNAFLGGINGLRSEVIVDSGSDITLISQKVLSSLLNTPRIKTGQKINLIQVTGNAWISGFVMLDLIFPTPEGPVKMNVEAYVVNGMSAPLILGNDFADQYSISILRE
ncbi:hypothetical protein NEOLEDRAFT_1031208, partial [Neolentinus lepideus HHB14362 ss-1]